MAKQPLSNQQWQQHYQKYLSQAQQNAQQNTGASKPAPQRNQSSSSGNGFWKGLALLLTGGTLVWGGQKYLNARAEQSREDRLMNNQPSMRQTLQQIQDEQSQLSSNIAPVDALQAAKAIYDARVKKCLEENDQAGLKKAKQDYDETVKALTEEPSAANPQPETLEQSILAARLAKDDAVRKCLERGDFKGAEEVNRKFNDYLRTVNGQPTRDDVITSVEDAKDMARDAADVSHSAAVVAANERSIADSKGRIKTDAHRRNAEEAACDASAATSRRVEAHQNAEKIVDPLDTINRGIRTGTRTIKSAQDFGKAVKHFSLGD